jgi:hypothetical protein
VRPIASQPAHSQSAMQHCSDQPRTPSLHDPAYSPGGTQPSPARCRRAGPPAARRNIVQQPRPTPTQRLNPSPTSMATCLHMVQCKLPNQKPSSGNQGTSGHAPLLIASSSFRMQLSRRQPFFSGAPRRQRQQHPATCSPHARQHSPRRFTATQHPTPSNSCAICAIIQFTTPGSNTPQPPPTQPRLMLCLSQGASNQQLVTVAPASKASASSRAAQQQAA